MNPLDALSVALIAGSLAGLLARGLMEVGHVYQQWRERQL